MWGLTHLVFEISVQTRQAIQRNKCTHAAAGKEAGGGGSDHMKFETSCQEKLPMDGNKKMSL